MPTGRQALQQTVEQRAKIAEERERRRNTIPDFFLREHEIAVVRSLATGLDDDNHFGAYEIHQQTGEGNWGNWEACPTAIDDVEGKCRCMLPRGWVPRLRYGTFLWVYRYLRLAVPQPQEGQQPLDWPRIVLSDSLMQEIYGSGTDPTGGVRYVQEVNAPRGWLRGPDNNDGFFKNYYTRLTQRSASGKLTGHNIVIMRGKDGRRGDFPVPDWRYEFADPTVNPVSARWPEVMIPVTPEIQAAQAKYFRALPGIEQYFLGTMKWPLFNEQQQSEPVRRQIQADPNEQTGVVIPPASRQYREEPEERPTITESEYAINQGQDENGDDLLHTHDIVPDPQPVLEGTVMTEEEADAAAAQDGQRPVTPMTPRAAPPPPIPAVPAAPEGSAGGLEEFI